VEKTSGLPYNEAKINQIRNFKKLILIAIHSASAKFGKTLIQEQEVLNNLTDMIIEVYLAESLALRIQKRENILGEDAAGLYRAILDVFVYDAANKLRKCAMDAFGSMEISEFHEITEKMTNPGMVNVKELRRKIAAKLIDENKYTF
jgi:alkylation response protein AidB-like acyl-CoA dehydrogenase